MQTDGETVDSGKIRGLARAVQRAGERVDRENAETKQLLYMKAGRSDRVARVRERAEAIKREITRIDGELTENEQETYRAETELKSVLTASTGLLQQLIAQKAQHSLFLSEKALEYRSRREFRELFKRSRRQQSLLQQIRENDGEIRALQVGFQRENDTEGLLQAFKEAENQAKSHEMLFSRLGEAASAYEITDIVDYWKYLQTTKSRLEVTINDCSGKIISLKSELDSSKTEFFTVKLMYDPTEQLTETDVSAILARIDDRNKNLDDKGKQVRGM